MNERNPKTPPEGGGRSGAEPRGTDAARAPAVIGRAKRPYLIASRRGTAAVAMNLRPMSAAGMRGAVSSLGLDIKRVIRPRHGLGPLALSADESQEVFLADIEPDRAEVLKASAPPQVLIEEDHRVGYGDQLRTFGRLPIAGRLTAAGLMETKPVVIRVLGEGDKPLEGASVQLTGDGFPGEGQTDRNGQVTVHLVTIPGGRARSLYVNSPPGYWDLFVTNPKLVFDGPNPVRARSVKEAIPGFPEQFRYGWGQRAMGVDRLPTTFDGARARIAIIDSGCDNTHPLLTHIQQGEDFTEGSGAATWSKDVIGHGTHCAGVIAAHGGDNQFLRGFAPGAEIFVFKVFPGGRFSSLVDALNRCIELEVDVVNMSLGSPDVSLIVEQKIEEAVAQGVACIVAAGNSGEAVQYPASSPRVLAVAAIGRLNEYPEDSWDASTVVPTLVAADGTFSPSFTCHGPQIGVCAPGVAIVSTIPGGYEPQSGTSMAAPHVTGLAALLLAHHPVFRGPLRARSAQRVAGLFNLIRSVCRPSPLGLERAGAGLPRIDGIEQILVPSARPPAEGATAPAQPAQPIPPPTAGIPGVVPAGAAAIPQAFQPGVAPFGVGAPVGGAPGQGALVGPSGSAVGQLSPFQGGVGQQQPGALLGRYSSMIGVCPHGKANAPGACEACWSAYQQALTLPFQATPQVAQLMPQATIGQQLGAAGGFGTGMVGQTAVGAPPGLMLGQAALASLFGPPWGSQLPLALATQPFVVLSTPFGDVRIGW